MQVFAESPFLNYSRISLVPVTRTNAVVAWDSIAVQAIKSAKLAAPEAARDLAILHAAQYDAVAAVEFPKLAYAVHVAAPRGASSEAAVHTASQAVLNGLFPAQASAFSGAFNAAFAGLPKTKAINDGLALGKEVGAATLASRSDDGSQTAMTLNISNVPGKWRPTPPSFLLPTDRQFDRVRPFEIASPSTFRPAAPPAVGTIEYNRSLAEVASLGRANGLDRTADQSVAALFWADGPGTSTSPGHWNEIAEGIASGRRDSLATDARIFAKLDFALADAAIAATDSQNFHDEWRPISAVRQTDPTFTSFVTTPTSPSYVSETAAYGAAASEVLTAAFGPKVKFADQHAGMPGTGRTFASFADAAVESANSQVWGGVNFSFDTAAGTILGKQVGQSVLANFPKGK